MVSCSPLSQPLPLPPWSWGAEGGRENGDTPGVTHAHESFSWVWIGAGLEMPHGRGSASSSFPGFRWLLVKLSLIFRLRPKLTSSHSRQFSDPGYRCLHQIYCPQSSHSGNWRCHQRTGNGRGPGSPCDGLGPAPSRPCVLLLSPLAPGRVNFQSRKKYFL